MPNEIVRYGFYCYRAYATQRTPFNGIWDGYYDIFDKTGEKMLNGAIQVNLRAGFTDPDVAWRTAEREARDSIDNSIGGQDFVQK